MVELAGSAVVELAESAVVELVICQGSSWRVAELTGYPSDKTSEQVDKTTTKK